MASIGVGVRLTLVFYRVEKVRSSWCFIFDDDDGFGGPCQLGSGTGATMLFKVHWPVEVLRTCPSTNVALARRAAAGRAKPPFVLVANHQTAGKGRQNRTWETPESGALTMSALLRPKVPSSALGLFPLFVALAAALALRELGFPASVKWPNDLLLPAATDVAGFGPWRKVGGILLQVLPPGPLADLSSTETSHSQVVVGVGINVGQAEAELPVPSATSLQSWVATPATLPNPPAVPSVTQVRDAVLVCLAQVISRWENGEEAELRAEYLEVCATIGQKVKVHGDLRSLTSQTSGVALGISEDGALLVRDGCGAVDRVHAADVSVRV
jgi:BirA family biotin operon repressor/biotin-[acetyl-CoA-carboxylase] ligase